MYHAIILTDLIDLANLLQHANIAERTALPRLGKIESEIRSLIPKMLNWLTAMSHPDGKPALFGIRPLTLRLG